jgi:hypothetical protein
MEDGGTLATILEAYLFAADDRSGLSNEIRVVTLTGGAPSDPTDLFRLALSDRWVEETDFVRAWFHLGALSTAASAEGPRIVVDDSCVMTTIAPASREVILASCEGSGSPSGLRVGLSLTEHQAALIPIRDGVSTLRLLLIRPRFVDQQVLEEYGVGMGTSFSVPHRSE